jgi:hypothetical protein
MLQDRESKLKLYSLGIVVSDKARDSDYIEVFPIEELPLSDGLISDIKHKYDVSLPDAKGLLNNTKLEGTNTLRAKWVPYGHSNRMSAPDVVKNETVVILRYADTDKYYWFSIFREPSLRRLETVLYAFGDLAKGLTAFNKDSSYWFEVSTHDKYIQLHTSSSDGEPFEYDIVIETETGSISVKDNVGNFYKLDSAAGAITVEATNEIILNAPKVTINASSNVVINTPTINANTSNVQVSGSIHAGGSIIDAGGNTNNHSH